MTEDPLASAIETVSVRVLGKVQGVGFRLATVRQARLLGVHGWVRNASDGSVEALLQGTANQIDRMLAWLREGPPAAEVHEVLSEVRYEDRRYANFAQH
ncbi:Acylphosphate phosphohydrolase, putative [plant metagenome]|uniref:Acylphosphate phosphohydrolase, putative n=1 Tax=plant metagenome TaxID=1297885 RepID=A0A484TAD5_9ZZZZ